MSEKTIVICSNKVGLDAFKGGWVSCEPYPDRLDSYRVCVTREQYEAMDGNEHDPWVDEEISP